MDDKTSVKPFVKAPVKPRVKSHSSQKSRLDLLAWKVTKLKELVFNHQSMEEKGTPQRKVRWGRSGTLRKSRLKRVRRDRVKRRISQRIDRQRRLKGRAHRTD